MDGLRPWVRWMIKHRLLYVLYAMNWTIGPIVVAAAAIADYVLEDGHEHHVSLREAARKMRGES